MNTVHISASPLLEIAVDTLDDGISAVASGASRLEICSRLDLGGLTPAEDLVRGLVDKVRVPLFVMIRPRGGVFEYTPAEFDMMVRQAEDAKAWGADGLVFGILTSDPAVDIERTKHLVELADPLPVTFHRAFDRCIDLETSAQALAEVGVKRILTSGGKESAEKGLETLRILQKKAGDHVIILPGGGVRPGNIRRILDVTGVKEIHSAARDANGKFSAKLVEEMREVMT